MFHKIAHLQLELVAKLTRRQPGGLSLHHVPGVVTEERRRIPACSALFTHDSEVKGPIPDVRGKTGLDGKDRPVLETYLPDSQILNRVVLVVPVRPLRDHLRFLVAQVGKGRAESGHGAR